GRVPVGAGCIFPSRRGGLGRPFLLDLAAELAAGGVDLRAFALADLDADAVLPQRRRERRQRLLRRPAVGQAFHVVEGDDVYVGVPSGGKGDRPLLCEAPSGPFRQKGSVPFSTAAAQQAGQV